jgi:hypothetical protein
MVNVDAETLSTMPDDPPAAGADRALDPAVPGNLCPEVAETAVAAVAVPEPLLVVALTMP